MASKPQKIYLDACIFIARANEDTSPQELQGILSIARRIEAGEYLAVTSVVTLCEVIHSNQQYVLEAFDGRRGYFANLDRNIAMKAQALRESARLPNSKKCLSAPDSIHIATAIEYGCSLMFSLDGKEENSPIKLAAAIQREYGLEITRPSADPTFQPPLL